MNEIWANRLIAGTQTWEGVPDFRKTEVKEVLSKRVENETITSARYLEITGEKYIVK